MEIISHLPTKKVAKKRLEPTVVVYAKEGKFKEAMVKYV